MLLIAFLVTCWCSAACGEYLLQALVRKVMDSRFGFSGRYKTLKEKNVKSLMETVGPPMGIGAGSVAFMHGLGMVSVVIFTVVVCLLPGILFAAMRVLRYVAITLDKLIDAYFSGGK